MSCFLIFLNIFPQFFLFETYILVILQCIPVYLPVISFASSTLAPLFTPDPPVVPLNEFRPLIYRDSTQINQLLTGPHPPCSPLNRTNKKLFSQNLHLRSKILGLLLERKNICNNKLSNPTN